MIYLRQTLALSTLVTPLASAQWLDDKLLGSCADLDCPQADNTTITANCRVANQTYSDIGVDTFPFNASSPVQWKDKNLTWTVAIHDYINYDPDTEAERTVEKAFFFGSSLDLRTAIGFGGCAVILEAYDKTIGSQDGTTTKKCEDFIGAECHKELQYDINRYATAQGKEKFNSSSEACDGLEEYLKSVKGDESKCDMDWTQVHYVPLIGDAAPEPLTRQQKASDNCYPTEPKSNNLTFVTNWNNTGTIYANDTIKMLGSVNLALTVFWDSAGEPNPESHVSCLWPAGETTRSRETKKPGEEEDGEDGAAGRVEGVVWAVLGAAFAAAWCLF